MLRPIKSILISEYALEKFGEYFIAGSNGKYYISAMNLSKLRHITTSIKDTEIAIAIEKKGAVCTPLLGRHAMYYRAIFVSKRARKQTVLIRNKDKAIFPDNFAQEVRNIGITQQKFIRSMAIISGGNYIIRRNILEVMENKEQMRQFVRFNKEGSIVTDMTKFSRLAKLINTAFIDNEMGLITFPSSGGVIIPEEEIWM